MKLDWHHGKNMVVIAEVAIVLFL